MAYSPANPFNEDAAHTSGDAGTQVLAVRNDTRGTLSSTSGDYTPLQTNSSGDLRVDNSANTQPISAASLPLPTGAAQDSTLTGGTQKTIMRGGAKGTTSAADVTSTAAGSNNQTLDVGVFDASGNRMPSMDAVARKGFHAITDGTNTATVKAASTAAVAADPALVVAVSPNNTVAVTQATASSLNAQVVGNVAAGAADSGNPLRMGATAKTANPTNATDGNRTNLIADHASKLVTVQSLRELKGKQVTTLTASTTETTIVTAAGASVFADLYGLVIANTSASACEVTIRDVTSTGTAMSFYVPAGDTRGFMLSESAAIPQGTANSAWTAQCGSSVSSIKITALYVKNL